MANYAEIFIFSTHVWRKGIDARNLLLIYAVLVSFNKSFLLYGYVGRSNHCPLTLWNLLTMSNCLRRFIDASSYTHSTTLCLWFYVDPNDYRIAS